MTIQKLQMFKKHLDSLSILFPGITAETLISLYGLEKKARRLSLKACNKYIPEEEWNTKVNSILQEVDELLHHKKRNIPIFLNSDPRGYSLKIKDNYIFENNISIWRDLGGYGILCPEITN